MNSAPGRPRDYTLSELVRALRNAKQRGRAGAPTARALARVVARRLLQESKHLPPGGRLVIERNGVMVETTALDTSVYERR